MELRNLVNSYLNYLKHLRRLSPGTVTRYNHTLSQFCTLVEELVGQKILVEEVKTLHIRRYMAWLSNERNYQNSSIKTAMRELRAFFNYAIQEGHIRKNPLYKLHIPKASQGEPEYLTEAELKKLFSAVDINSRLGLRDLTVLKTLYYTGLRVSELCNLRLVDIGESMESLIIRGGKGNKDRILPVHGHLRIWLKRYLKWRRSPSPYLFITLRLGKCSNHAIENIMRKHVTIAGLPANYTVHTLRHTFATHLANAGVKINYVCDLLGHACIDTTMIYAHRTVDQLAHLVNRI